MKDLEEEESHWDENFNEDWDEEETVTTKHFCSKCEIEIEKPCWLLELSQLGVYGPKKLLCKGCKEKLESWLGGVTERKIITGKQIRKVLDLTSFKFHNRGTIKRAPNVTRYDDDLGSEEYLIAEARKILGITGEEAQTDEPIVTDTAKKEERSRRVLYHLQDITNHAEYLRRLLVKEGVISEPVPTPQEELVDVSAVRTVQDEGEGSTVQGEENPS